MSSRAVVSAAPKGIRTRYYWLLFACCFSLDAIRAPSAPTTTVSTFRRNCLSRRYPLVPEGLRPSYTTEELGIAQKRTSQTLEESPAAVAYRLGCVGQSIIQKTHRVVCVSSVAPKQPSALVITRCYSYPLIKQSAPLTRKGDASIAISEKRISPPERWLLPIRLHCTHVTVFPILLNESAEQEEALTQKNNLPSVTSLVFRFRRSTTTKKCK